MSCSPSLPSARPPFLQKLTFNVSILLAAIIHRVHTTAGTAEGECYLKLVVSRKDRGAEWRRYPAGIGRRPRWWGEQLYFRGDTGDNMVSSRATCGQRPRSSSSSSIFQGGRGAQPVAYPFLSSSGQGRIPEPCEHEHPSSLHFMPNHSCPTTKLRLIES